MNGATDSVITATEHGLHEYCLEVANRARVASRQLTSLATTVKDVWLLRSADALVDATARIVEANQLDLAAAPDYGLSDAAVDRLRLDATRIAKIADAMREIAALRDPIGETIEGHIRPNGLEVRKVRVPLGTVFFIYESRPNVTVDAAAICVKSGNSVILRGGKEAQHSSRVMVEILAEIGEQVGLPENSVQLVNTTDREAVGHFLRLPELIDVAIPRGGHGLIERVVSEAKMPVIKHFDGNCHVYVDASAEDDMAIRIIVNSKCQRMGVCNACEGILVNAKIAKRLLPKIARELQAAGVEIRGDQATCDLIPQATTASEEDWSTEFLGPILSCRIVDDIDQAIAHINRYGSKHTDAIVTSELAAANRFLTEVDSSAVVVNASTRFNDGGELGLGAEIGISTDKFHARGPCGLKELTTYKYLITGTGQIRS